MKIHLNETEIQRALIEFVGNQGFDTTGRGIVVTLTAGRGVNGHSADIEILERQPIVLPDIDEPAEEQPAIKFSFGDDT